MSNRQNAYVEKLQARIDELQAEIDKLKAQSKHSQASAKIALENQLEEIVRKRQKLKTLLAEVGQAGSGAWHDLQLGAEQAWRELAIAVENARRQFR